MRKTVQMVVNNLKREFPNLTRGAAIRAYLDDICRVAAEPMWVDINEVMPKENEIILVTAEKTSSEGITREVRLDMLSSEGEFINNRVGSRVTAWMKTPKAYKKEPEYDE